MVDETEGTEESEKKKVVSVVTNEKKEYKYSRYFKETRKIYVDDAHPYAFTEIEDGGSVRGDELGLDFWMDLETHRVEIRDRLDKREAEIRRRA